MNVKHFNLAGDYEVFLLKCIEERLWIRQQRRWWGAYDWAWEFGVSWVGFNYAPTLGDPFGLITEARMNDLSPDQLTAVDRFEIRVRDYYASGKDEKLLKTMETRVWVF